MIVYKDGNILESRCEVLVNPVNTVGVMGAGLALKFKKAFPENYKRYKAVCSSREFDIGRILLSQPEINTHTGVFARIANFPTKKHYNNPSDYLYIEKGMTVLSDLIKREKLKSVALPMLGCGLGGLHWGMVYEIMLWWLEELEDCEYHIYGKPVKLI